MGQKRFGHLIFGLMGVAVIILTGCGSTHDVAPVKKEGPEGISEVYPVNFDEAWEIGKAVFGWEGRHKVEEHRDQGYMLSSRGIGMVAWGTVIVATFQPVDGENTKVTFLTKQRVTVNPTASAMKEDAFHHRFAQAVEILKKGESLPSEPPD